jgi:hypothetical protein
MAGYQAAALSGWETRAEREPRAGRPLPAGCRALVDWLAGVIGPIEDDRPFGEDLERLTEATFNPRI